MSGATCNWQEFYTTWDSGGNTSVEICITNQNTALSGNDFALDDIFFGEICRDEKEFTVTVDEFTLFPPFQMDLDCNQPTGELAVTPIPTISGYQFEWSTVDGIINTSHTNPEITVASAGSYVVTVTNQNGCTQSQDYIVYEDFNLPIISISGDLTLDCKQKSSVLSASSSNGLETFNWILPDQSTKASDSIVIQSPGKYIATSQSLNGCIGSDTVLVTLDLAQFQYQDDSSGVLTCSVDQVQIFLDVVTILDSIVWSGPDILETNATKDTITVGQSGTYYYELFVGSDCSIKDSIKINQLPIALSYDLPVVDTITCIKTSAEIFLLNTQGIDNTKWYQNGQLLSESDSITVNNSGKIFVELTDINGCKKSDSLTIESDILQPQIVVTLDSIDCLDDYGQFLTQYQGNGIFYWEGQDLTSFDKNPSFKSSGNYSLKVIGENGCIHTGIYFLPSKKKFPIIDGMVEKITCDNPVGIISLSTDIPVSFMWNDGSANSGTSNVISSSIAGTFNIEALTTEGCVSYKTFTLTIDTLHPVLMDLSDLLLTCKDSIMIPNVVASQYNDYAWFGPGINQNSIIQPSINLPGSYSLQLSNTNGCITEKSFLVKENKTKPDFTVIANELNCIKPNTPLSINSLENLTYFIGQKLISSGYIIDSVGNYIIKAVNEFGCEKSLSLTVIGNFDLPIIDVKPVFLNCDQPELWISDTAIDPNLEYSWQTANGILSHDSILITTNEEIELIAKNSSGCESRFKVLVETDFDKPVFTIDGNKIIGCNESFTDISITSKQNETYLWTGPGINISGNSSIRIFEEGDFEIVVGNTINGCKNNELFEIKKEIGPNGMELMVEQPNCFGEKGSIIVKDIYGGTSPYEITIEQSQVIKGQELIIPAGNYHLLVTDQNGCTTVDQITIEKIEEFSVNAGIDTTILRNESYKLNPTSSLSWSEVDLITWAPAETLDCDYCPFPTASPTVDTKYTITIQNEKGCIETDEVLVRVRFLKGFTTPNIFNPKSTSGNNAFTIYPIKSSIAIINYLQIFDRWGNLVFSINDIPAGDPDYGWNGTLNGKYLIPGVYVWVSQIEYLDLTTEIISGDVTIIQ